MHPDNSPSIIIQWQPEKKGAQDESSWLIVDSQQQGNGLTTLKAKLAQESATDNADIFLQHEAVLLIPAECTLTARVFVPSAKPAHIHAAIPHLIEEWTFADNESLHLSHGERSDDGHVAVTAIDRDHFTQCVNDMDSSHIYCRAIYTDASLLPYTSNALTLLIDSTRALFRWNSAQAGALELTALIPFLTALYQRQSFDGIDVFSTTDTNPALLNDIEQCLTTLTENATPIHRYATEMSLLYFCTNQLSISSRHAINLRQGEFAPQQTQFKHWQRWKPLAIATAICLIVQISLNVIAGWRFERQAEKTHEQAVQLYRELFPGDKRIVNLRQQFQNHLNNGTQADQQPFFALFGRLAQEIQATQTTNPIQLHSLVYDTKTGSLQVELVAPSVPVLDDLQKRLSTNNFAAKVTSAQNADGVVIGRLSLMGKSS